PLGTEMERHAHCQRGSLRPNAGNQRQETDVRVLQSLRDDMSTTTDERNWLQHPRAAEVIAYIDESGVTDAHLIHWHFQETSPSPLHRDVVEHILVSYTRTEDYEYRRRESGRSSSQMPANLQTAIFKRTAYVEDQIAERRARKQPVNYYIGELDALL